MNFFRGFLTEMLRIFLPNLEYFYFQDNLSFQLVEEATLLLPEYTKLEIEKSIYNLLGIKYSDQSQEHRRSQNYFVPGEITFSINIGWRNFGVCSIILFLLQIIRTFSKKGMKDTEKRWCTKKLHFVCIS